MVTGWLIPHITMWVLTFCSTSAGRRPPPAVPLLCVNLSLSTCLCRCLSLSLYTYLYQLVSFTPLTPRLWTPLTPRLLCVAGAALGDSVVPGQLWTPLTPRLLCVAVIRSAIQCMSLRVRHFQWLRDVCLARYTSEGKSFCLFVW